MKIDVAYKHSLLRLVSENISSGGSGWSCCWLRCWCGWTGGAWIIRSCGGSCSELVWRLRLLLKLLLLHAVERYLPLVATEEVQWPLTGGGRLPMDLTDNREGLEVRVRSESDGVHVARGKTGYRADVAHVRQLMNQLPLALRGICAREHLFVVRLVWEWDECALVVLAAGSSGRADTRSSASGLSFGRRAGSGHWSNGNGARAAGWREQW